MVRHGEGSNLAWACMPAPEAGSPIFIDESHDGCSRKNSEAYWNILSTNLQKNTSSLIRKNFMQQFSDPKYTAKTTINAIREEK